VPTNERDRLNERYLTATEVAGLLYVSPKTITRWAAEGKLPCIRTLGGHRRYPEVEIRAIRDQLLTAAEQPAQVKQWGSQDMRDKRNLRDRSGGV
jgi:excisionase family DNA binding protein